MTGITQNGRKRLVFIAVPQLRNAAGSGVVKKSKDGINNKIVIITMAM